jgi:capsular polysaccharide export protein
MINGGLQQYAGKRILLLQGPVGPFFARFAADLRSAGAEVFKINFNAGDWFFFPRGALNYRGSMAAWPEWLAAQLRHLRIDTMFLFGDCRPIHRPAHAVAESLGVQVAVFEEGYVRPDYITLERCGVNGYSCMSRNPADYTQEFPLPLGQYSVGNAYWAMVWWGFLYFLVGWLGRLAFPQYVHHRPMTALEAWPWVRSVWRKQWYRWAERGLQERLTAQESGRYYLVPLQVFNDSQLTVHARVEGVEGFVVETLASFAQHADGDTLLVFKHHPMDRGYRDYGRLIRKIAAGMGLGHRVLYIHDQHLPSLLDHARGVVVVNSTVGLSALHHGAPTKVCGKALYDIPGLTFQGELAEFWRGAPASRPDPVLYRRFRSHLLARTQVNGSFYRRLNLPATQAGLAYGGGTPRTTASPSGMSPLEAEWMQATSLNVGDLPRMGG